MSAGLFELARGIASAPALDALMTDAPGPAPIRCASVTWPLQRESVVCQLEAGHAGRHQAVGPVFGRVDWGAPAGYRHRREVESGACDPDHEHDVARESGTDPFEAFGDLR